MFHSGDLQSGIGQAISEGKLVTCFIRDDSEESLRWENSWLSEDEVQAALLSRAVVLRIENGSQEAGFLSAFCPIYTAPMIIVIQNGQPKDVIKNGCTQDEFRSRILACFDNGSSVQVPVAETSAASSSRSRTDSTQASSNVDMGRSSEGTSTATTDNQRNPDLATQSPSSVSPSQPSPAVDRPPAKADNPARQGYLTQQRQRNLEARQERERILAQIEADKVARREKAQQRKQEMSSQETTSSPVPANKPKARSQGTSANLSVRLLDGANVRKSFPATATLDCDVRAWLASEDSTLSARPYTFKHLLAPQPARNITTSEEVMTLQDLEFLPSASLVLLPVEQGKFVNAYAGGASGGVWSLASIPYNVVSGALGMVSSATGAMTGALGYGATEAADSSSTAQTSPGPSEQPAAASQSTSNAGIRIRTLADQRRDEGQNTQLYNGNQSNVESNGRKGDEDKP